MRRMLLYLVFGAALLGACGPTDVQRAADTAATAAAGPEAATAEAGLATAVSGPEMATAMAIMATVVSGPEAATAMAETMGALAAVEEDVVLQQGAPLVLDATRSAGNITNYQWTIVDAPAGAESVEGRTIKEESSGTVSLNPDEYAQYFPVSGTYTVRLTVTDTQGATADTEFTIVVP